MQPIANKIAKKQAGYSLVELSVALAIVAVILVGGLMGTRQILLTNNIYNQLKDSAQVIAKACFKTSIWAWASSCNFAPCVS